MVVPSLNDPPSRSRRTQHKANRALLAGGVESFLLRGRDPDSCYEDDDEADAAPPPVCVDTWELARRLGAAQAHGCIASTCHNWFGLSASFQHNQMLTQGPGSNSIDVFDSGEHALPSQKGKLTISQKGKHSVVTAGSARYIDWLLVDLHSVSTLTCLLAT